MSSCTTLSDVSLVDSSSNISAGYSDASEKDTYDSNVEKTVVTVTNNGTLTRRPVKPKRTPSTCSTTRTERIYKERDRDR